MNTSDATPWLELAGRIHPIVVQLPVGMVVSLVVLELWAVLRRRALTPGTRRVLAWSAALGVVAAGLSGWVLALEGPFATDTLRLHRIGGVLLVVMACVLAATTWLRGRGAYVKALAVCVALLIPVGWLGGELTHGEGFPFQHDDVKTLDVPGPGRDDEQGAEPSTPSVVPSPLQTVAPEAALEPEPAPPASATPLARVTPDEGAIEALRARQIHVEVIDPVSGTLWIDAGAARGLTDDEVSPWFGPVAGAIADLSFAGTEVGDGAARFAASLPRLERLDVSNTRVTSAGLATLVDAPRLARLNVTATGIDDDAIDALAAMASLRELFAFDTGISREGAARLAADRADIALVVDTSPPAAVLDVESPPVLLAAQSLKAVNTMCPVSGGPVDPAFQIIHDGRVVGFCCSECPTRFWADPNAFPVAE